MTKVFGNELEKLLQSQEMAGQAIPFRTSLMYFVGVKIAFANVAAALTVLMVFYGSPAFGLALFWFGSFITANGAALVYMARNKTDGSVKSGRSDKKGMSGKGAFDPAGATALNAFCWTMLAVMLFPVADTGQRVFITAIISGMMGGGAAIMSPMPRLGMIYCVVLSSGAFVTLFAEGSPVYLVIAGLLGIYVFTLAWVLKGQAKLLAERIRVASELEKSNQMISTLLQEYEDNGSEWLWETDASGKFVNVSKRGEELSGMSSSSMERLSFSELFIPEHVSRANGDGKDQSLGVSMRKQKPFRDQIVIVNRLDSLETWCKITGRPIFSEEEEFVGYRGVCVDVTEKKQAERKLAKLALSDSLTGLANRANFSAEISEAIRDLHNEGRPFAVMVMDLNKFKRINDTLGHPTGDAVLVEAANRIRKALRGKGYVARLGGDEFAIIIRDYFGADEVEQQANALRSCFEMPINARGRMVSVQCSIGIALAPENGRERDELLKNADLALYRAKEYRNGGYCFFFPDMDLKVRERNELELELREAINRKELKLHYQPIMDVAEHKVCGYEALIRWPHPVRGMISPERFIPIAEESGMISEIGEMVIRTACLEAASWPNRRKVAVNLSPEQFNGVALEKVVVSALAQSGLEPWRLELEITESILIDNKQETLKTLENLRSLGVRISLDDFGTGYSSLLYLVSFPFDKIKIDQSFVRQAEDSNDQMLVVRAIIGLAKSLGMRTTAEGVEERVKYDVLCREGCNEIQGYLISRPVPCEDLQALDAEVGVRFGTEFAVEDATETNNSRSVA